MYLGCLLNLTEPEDREINYRIQRAWAKFAVYRNELTNKEYSLSRRLQLFNAVVTPTMLYGCCWWAMAVTKERALRTVQMKMLRTILGRARQRMQQPSMTSDGELEETLEGWIQWVKRVAEETLDMSAKLNLPDWVDEQGRRYFRWAGHTVRREDGRWTTKAVRFILAGYRNRGHPKRRWGDAMQEHLNKYWPNVHCWKSARDREWWASEVEHFLKR